MESNDDLKDQLQQLTQIYQQMDWLYHTMAAGCGLADAAYWALYALYDADGPLTQQDLCRLWSYSKQTVHSAVISLRRQGYVTLQGLEGRKGKAVALTEQGRRFCQSTVALLFEAEARAFARLTLEEREQLLALYRKHFHFLQQETQDCIQTIKLPD